MGQWQLCNDSTGAVIDAGSEADMKGRYLLELEKGEIPEMDLFLEAPDGRQYAYNRNVTPNRWDEI